MTDELKRRQNLTFSQGAGLAELPRPLNLEEMPWTFRLMVWEYVHASIKQGHTYPYICLADPWRAIVSDLWKTHFENPHDTFSDSLVEFVRQWRKIILHGPFYEVFDLLTALLRHPECPPDLKEQVGLCLQKHQMAYYLDTSGPPTFMPQSSPQEGEAVRAAMSVLAESGMDGARAHLQKAAEMINGEQFADAIRESIHAVESVAKIVSEKADATLGDAIKELQGRGLHSALGEGFKKLYGYTSNEKGIRHALLEKNGANAGQAEALFMFGACALFCGYLCRKRSEMSGDS